MKSRKPAAAGRIGHPRGGPFAPLCPEAVALLGDRRLGRCVLRELEVLRPGRQIEVVQSMIAMNRFTIDYAGLLVMATPAIHLTARRKRRGQRLAGEALMRMQRSSAKLERRMLQVQGSINADGIDLVLIRGFLDRLLSNARAVRYLAQFHPEQLRGFQELVDGKVRQCGAGGGRSRRIR